MFSSNRKTHGEFFTKKIALSDGTELEIVEYRGPEECSDYDEMEKWAVQFAQHLDQDIILPEDF